MARFEVQFAPASGRRVALSTLGCKINAFESELIAQALRGERWHMVDARAEADLYVINTCTVTREADRQARQAVRRAVRRNPAALVVVTGCYAQMNPQACAAIPGVDLVVGNDRKLDIHRLLPALERGALPPVLVGDSAAQISLPDQLLDGFAGQTRAFVQVQQGCNQACTFCVIHRARGPGRSLPPARVRRQVERLVMNGYKEIVLCGVDLGSYGEDFTPPAGRPGYGLVALISELAALDGDFRLRLSSIDPAHLDAALVDLMASQAKLCPHLHLSLQSANTLILKRMKRRYHRDHVYERVATLRARLPSLVLSADIMAGFPTETEAEFSDTLCAVHDLEIAYPHVFVYSGRPGTPAVRIPRQVPVVTRRARAARLRAAGATVRAQVMRRRLGSRQRLLVEAGGDPPPGLLRARLADYLPAWVPAGAAVAGDWLAADLYGLAAGALLARPAA